MAIVYGSHSVSGRCNGRVYAVSRCRGGVGLGCRAAWVSGAGPVFEAVWGPWRGHSNFRDNVRLEVEASNFHLGRADAAGDRALQSPCARIRADKGLRRRVTRQGEEAIGKLAQELLENPVGERRAVGRV